MLVRQPVAEPSKGGVFSNSKQQCTSCKQQQARDSVRSWCLQEQVAELLAQR